MLEALRKASKVRERLHTAKLMAKNDFPAEGKAVLLTLDSLVKSNVSAAEWRKIQKKDIKREKCTFGMFKNGKFMPNDVQNINSMIANAQRYISAVSQKKSAVA